MHRGDFGKSYRDSRDAQLSRRLNPRVQDFAQWLQVNAARLPIEAG